MKSNILFTDYYEFTSGRVNLDFKRNPVITESYFFRKPLKGYQFMLAVGQHHLTNFIADLNEGTMTEHMIEWLEKTGGGDLNQDFLDYLANFDFDGSVTAPDLGTPMFPHEAVVNITGRSIDVQILETYLLHIMNTQSPVATTAALLRNVAGKRSVVDFGARRSFNPMLTAEAAIIGGADATSLVQAGYKFDVPYVGTMPHKFIQERWDGEMSFSESELLAFREYAHIYPHNSVLLVDTYNTMNGILNAIIVARELRQGGYALKGIRLDSGDLTKLSKDARHMFNAAGFPSVRIYVSDRIDPQSAHKLLEAGAAIDGFGVGTRLVHPGEALGGVYKMVQAGDIYYMKFTDNPKKMTIPARRNVWRFYDQRGMYSYDTQSLWDEIIEGGEPLHKDWMDKGCIHIDRIVDTKSVATYVAKELKRMKPILRRARIGNTNLQPAPYRVEMSKDLENVRKDLITKYEAEFGKVSHKSWTEDDWKERMNDILDQTEDYLHFSMNPRVAITYEDDEE